MKHDRTTLEEVYDTEKSENGRFSQKYMYFLRFLLMNLRVISLLFGATPYADIKNSVLDPGPSDHAPGSIVASAGPG
jgi:hypothetical protein